MSNDTQLWCGIDLAKRSFDAAVVSDRHVKDISAISVKHFKNTQIGIANFIKWLRDRCKKHKISLSQTHLVVEATGRYSTDFYDEMSKQSEDLRVSIVNPAHATNFRKSLGLRSKTDALDARALGIFARERKPDLYRAPSPQYQALKKLFRQRIYYVSQRVAQEARLGEADTKVTKQIESNAIESTKKIIEEIESEIKALLNQEHEFGRDIELLMTIPGVGLMTAVAVLAELGDLRRFVRASELASFAGLAPQLHESGTSVQWRTRLSKEGNKQIRRGLYMAALAWTRRCNEGLGVFYARLVAAGKAKKSALLAVTRKLLVLMRAILISGKPYEERVGGEKGKEESAENESKKGGKLRLEPKF